MLGSCAVGLRPVPHVDMYSDGTLSPGPSNFNLQVDPLNRSSHGTFENPRTHWVQGKGEKGRKGSRVHVQAIAQVLM